MRILYCAPGMGTLLKAIAALLGLGALALAVWFGINATDEPLSDEARAALDVPPPPAPSKDNGFLDFLTLGAPAETPAYEAGLERLNAFNHQEGGEVAPAPWKSFRVDPRVPRCAFGALTRDAS